MAAPASRCSGDFTLAGMRLGICVICALFHPAARSLVAVPARDRVGVWKCGGRVDLPAFVLRGEAV